MTRPKGKLLDASGIVADYGVSQWVAEKWMRQLPKIVNPGGVRKTYVKRSDIERLVNESEQAA